MSNMITFDLPKNQSSIIKVIGVGGGGSNAISHMYNQGIRGVDFIVCNTDAQAMETSPIPTKIQLGKKGLGAGSIPSVGKESAQENIEDIRAILEKNTKMLFITAGMGGGTGTGAAPVIAEVARDLDILTVGIVTIPFSFEGRKRKMQAEQGIEELRAHVDTLLVVSNDKLRELYGDLKLSEAFHRADDILTTAAKGIAEIVTVTGYINVDFEDVKTVMKDSGKAIMGSAVAEGETRALNAVKLAMASPLLDDNEIAGASNILLYISSGTEEISMDEVTEITDYIQDEAGQNAEIIWGNGTDEELENKISVTLIATGFDSKNKNTGVDRDNLIIHKLNDEITNKPVESKPVEDEVIEEIKLIRESEPQKLVKTEVKVEMESKKEQRTIIFDLNGPAPEEPSKPIQKIHMNDPALMKKQSLKKENSTPEFTIPLITKSEPEIEKEENSPNEIESRANARVQKLKDLSIKLKSPADLENMEKVPAYMRRKVELNDIPASDKSSVSRFSLSDNKNEETTLKENNSFLHENVD
jgi:cell division protein FtsZ